MTKRFTRYAKLFISFLILSSMLQFCASQKTGLQSTDIEATFKSGMDYFEKENYLKAEETFTFIIYNDPGGAYADDAQFYLAETYFAKDEFLLAISEYDRLIRRMKNSTFVEDAFWRKAEAYVELSPDYRLQRDMTDKALRFLYDFLEIYPESKHAEDARLHIQALNEKLARKALETGSLYSTLRENESAIYYYDSVINDYSDTKLYAAARLGKIGALVNLNKWAEARELMNSLVIDGRDDLTPKEIIKMKKLAEKILEASPSDGK